MELLTDYDYHLPEELIAQSPLENRSNSKLLYLHKSNGKIEDRAFGDVIEILRPGDLLVLNNTRVTALRLLGRKPTGGAVEALLLKEIAPATFEAMLKPGKSLKPGARIEFAEDLAATVMEDLNEPLKRIKFDETVNLHERLHSFGKVPLPPYIHTNLQNPERYQTVYATSGGSAAAPTAGLHFTEEIFKRLTQKGIDIAHVTLDVSLDTFRPVVANILDEHKMHGETCAVSPSTADKINKASGRIVAVGTTTVRTLESFAIGDRRVESGSKSTSIFIRPGYGFRVVDGMFTNFHMPKTTMLMMISALAGREKIFEAYEHAIRYRYRFLSFGDSMLIL